MKSIDSIRQLSERTFYPFDIVSGQVKPLHPDLPSSIDQGELDRLLQERSAAKSRKDYAQADAIRAHIQSLGIDLQDTIAGDQLLVKRRSPRFPRVALHLSEDSSPGL